MTTTLSPIDQHQTEKAGDPAFQWKLWLYTNYDCNLTCSYCVAESSPSAPRRALGLGKVRHLVDEAFDLGFTDIFFTGGEPFLLDDIYDMLAYASARVRTTVLTNAMLLRGRRLEKLAAIANDNLIVQVSLDGGRPDDHDAYRGQGSWAKTVAGIKSLQANGLRVRIGTTETPINAPHLDKLHEFRRSLNIPDDDHFVRPLAKLGFAQEGIEVDPARLVPELTVTIDGVFWHPLTSPSQADMQVNNQIFPLKSSVEIVQEQLRLIAETGQAALQTFT